MDVVFAKAVASPKHHYSRLLSKAPTEDFFEAKQAASPRLYTVRGVAKGHRRSTSGSEEPTSPTIPDALSARTLEHLRQKQEVFEEVMQLIARLQRERKDAETQAETLRKEVEDARLVAQTAQAKTRAAEEESERLRALLSLSPARKPVESRSSHSADRKLKGGTQGKTRPKAPGFGSK